MKHTPPPLFFPESSLFLSARCTENPDGCMDGDSISQESHVSVKQNMLQSKMFLWKEILALSLSTLLYRYCTLASNILRSGGWCAPRLLSRTRSPLRIHLLRRQCFDCPGGYEQRIQFGKVVFLVNTHKKLNTAKLLRNCHICRRHV
jgi:hypothetical protein